MKKIAIFTNHFYPEDFRINDIAENLSKDFEVTVITQIPNYPRGSYYKKYGLLSRRKEILNKNLKVKRLFSIPRKNNKFFLFLNYISYYFSSFCYSLSKKDFDYVFVYVTSPIFISKAAIRTAKKSQAQITLYLLDLWPDNLYSILNIQNSGFKEWFNKYCANIYRSMDNILISSKSFKSDLVNMGIASKKIDYLPQHETHFQYIKPKPISNVIQILFAGNIGEAQGLDVLIAVAEIAMQNQNQGIHFNIIGEGRYKKTFKTNIKEAGVDSYFSIKPRVSRDELDIYYKENSFGLVILKDDEVLNRHLPLKVQSYMSQGLPIIAIAKGETKMIIQESNSGIVINDYDPFLIFEVIKELSSMSLEKHMKMSEDAYKYAQKNFSLNITMSKIKEKLSEGDYSE